MGPPKHTEFDTVEHSVRLRFVFLSANIKVGAPYSYEVASQFHTTASSRRSVLRLGLTDTR